MTHMRDALHTKSVARLTISITTRDRASLLARCLDTLLVGDVLPAEIIVVDQSRDDQAELVVEQRQVGEVSLRYIRSDERSFATRQNLAFAQATEPLVAVTDDDCVPTAGWVAHIERLLVPSSPIDVVTGPVLPLGPDRPGLYAVSSRTSLLPTTFTPRALPWDIGSGGNFAARREWLDRIGGNDERLGPGTAGQGGTDMDLFYRLLRAGACIQYAPALLVYHERATKAGRLGRRFPYGFGMGAACSLWLRQGDRNAVRVLAHWWQARLWRLAGALRRREWAGIQEELLVLRGTVGGLAYGLRVPPQNDTHA